MTTENNLPLCIIGAGGFGREVLCLYIDICRQQRRTYADTVVFAEDDAHWQQRMIMDVPVVPLSAMRDKPYEFVIAIGNPQVRAGIAASMPEDTRWATLVHPAAIMSQWVTAGPGSIVCAGAVLTCNITLGRHTHINLNTTIGHDVTAGDFFTTAPGAAISGNCSFGNQVYMGSNACIREKITVTGNVTIGMGAVVVQHITEPGVYAGNPAKKIS
jgi:sugar O-acyltransferase (sialic acid O-acetyltransferase NeuD family)